MCVCVCVWCLDCVVLLGGDGWVVLDCLGLVWVGLVWLGCVLVLVLVLLGLVVLARLVVLVGCWVSL